MHAQGKVFDLRLWLAGQPARVRISLKGTDERKLLIPALFPLVRKERMNCFLESMQNGDADLALHILKL